MHTREFVLIIAHHHFRLWNSSEWIWWSKLWSIWPRSCLHCWYRSQLLHWPADWEWRPTTDELWSGQFCLCPQLHHWHWWLLWCGPQHCRLHWLWEPSCCCLLPTVYRQPGCQVSAHYKLLLSIFGSLFKEWWFSFLCSYGRGMAQQRGVNSYQPYGSHWTMPTHGMSCWKNWNNCLVLFIAGMLWPSAICICFHPPACFFISFLLFVPNQLKKWHYYDYNNCNY